LDREIADYEAALRINPQFDQAAENLAAARAKRDRRNAVNSDNLLPSFDCKKATRAVEKAICSDPDLSRLDREMDAAYKAALASLTGKASKRLKQEQQEFLATRNKSFGKPQYNFRRETELRLAALRGMTAATDQNHRSVGRTHFSEIHSGKISARDEARHAQNHSPTPLIVMRA